MAPQKLDLTNIIRTRVRGWKGKLIPGILLKGLEKLICQRELNDILATLYPREGSEFAKGVYNYLDLRIEVKGLDKIPEGGRYVFASNHPLGGLDGIGLIMVLGSKYGDDNVRFIVNDMLLNIEPLKSVFLPVNKYGSQARGAAKIISEAYMSDKQIVMFPAGLVSRLHPDDSIRDLQWQKSFVSKAIESGRQIVPVRFEALNRKRFYRIAYWRKKLKIGVNLEQALLPGEVIASRGKSFRVKFGCPVDPLAYREEGLSLKQIAEKIRSLSEGMIINQ